MHIENEDNDCSLITTSDNDGYSIKLLKEGFKGLEFELSYNNLVLLLDEMKQSRKQILKHFAKFYDD